MIVQTSAGQFYQVREATDASLAHVWFGTEVKRSGVSFIPKKNAREILVRKSGCSVVAREG